MDAHQVAEVNGVQVAASWRCGTSKGGDSSTQCFITCALSRLILFECSANSNLARNRWENLRSSDAIQFRIACDSPLRRTHSPRIRWSGHLLEAIIART